mgnify:CR=1 FL=1
MSYSFSVRGASVGEVLAKCEEQFALVEKQQPIHAVDRAQAMAAVRAFVGVLPPSGREISVSVHGYVAWAGDLDDQALVRALSTWFGARSPGGVVSAQRVV